MVAAFRTVVFNMGGRLNFFLGSRELTEIWSFCQHAQFYFAERRGLSWFSYWKSHHENAEENSTAYVSTL